MDSRTWGGWAEIVLIADRWNLEISLCWRESERKASLRAQTERTEPRVRAAVLFHPTGHYDVLLLSAPAWAAVDAAWSASSS